MLFDSRQLWGSVVVLWIAGCSLGVEALLPDEPTSATGSGGAAASVTSSTGGATSSVSASSSSGGGNGGSAGSACDTCVDVPAGGDLVAVALLAQASCPSGWDTPLEFAEVTQPGCVECVCERQNEACVVSLKIDGGSTACSTDNGDEAVEIETFDVNSCTNPIDIDDEYDVITAASAYRATVVTDAPGDCLASGGTPAPLVEHFTLCTTPATSDGCATGVCAPPNDAVFNSTCVLIGSGDTCPGQLSFEIGPLQQIDADSRDCACDCDASATCADETVRTYNDLNCTVEGGGNGVTADNMCDPIIGTGNRLGFKGLACPAIPTDSGQVDYTGGNKKLCCAADPSAASQ